MIRKVNLSIAVIMFSLFFCYGTPLSFSYSNLSTNNCFNGIGDTIKISLRIAGMEKPEDAMLIDQTLMKTGLVLSAYTDFTDAICKVEVDDLNNNKTDKIIEHIRSVWKKLGYIIDAELIEMKAIY